VDQNSTISLESWQSTATWILVAIVNLRCSPGGTTLPDVTDTGPLPREPVASIITRWTNCRGSGR
jgi:hypothetical protein